MGKNLKSTLTKSGPDSRDDMQIYKGYSESEGQTVLSISSVLFKQDDAYRENLKAAKERTC